MARLVTLAQLQTQAYRIGDLENAVTRFPAQEVTDYLNAGVAELYDLLVRSRGDYFESNFQFTTDGINTVFPLAADHYQLTLAQVIIGFSSNGVLSDNTIGLYQFNMGERPELSSSTPGYSGQPFCYRIHGGSTAQAGTTQGTIPVQYAIELLPKPAVNMKIVIYYIPTPPLLINQNDTLDSISGWDLYASAFAAKMMRLKDDLPTTAQDALMASVRERVEALAPHRDAYSVKRVTDLRRRWPAYSWRRRRVS